VEVKFPRHKPVGHPVQLPPEVKLVGREGPLAEMDARRAKGTGDGPRIVALHGMGGAAKTSLAAHYGRLHKAARGIVWQFPAEEAA
jgi:hypothetical protein